MAAKQVFNRSSVGKASTRPNGPAPVPQYLHQRGNVYYFKRKIPAGVERAFPEAKGQMWKSLDTTHIGTALVLLDVEVKSFELRVAEERRRSMQGDASAKPKRSIEHCLASVHIPALLSRYEHAHLVTDDEERPGLSRFEVSERLANWGEGIEHLQQSLAVDDFSGVVECARDLLRGERLIAAPGSTAWNELLHALARKDIEVLRHQRDRLMGLGTRTSPNVPVAPRDMPHMRPLFESWQRGQSNQKTIDAVERCVAEWERLHRQLPLEAITKRHAKDYRDVLIAEGLATETIKNRLGYLRAIWNHECDEIEIEAKVNPFEGIPVSAAHLCERLQATRQRRRSRLLDASSRAVRRCAHRRGRAASTR